MDSKRHLFVKRFSELSTNGVASNFGALSGVRLSKSYNTDFGKLTIYDIDNTDEAQYSICRWMNEFEFQPFNLGRAWSVFSYNEDGNPTRWAAEDWDLLRDVRKYKIALLDNKICGLFFSDAKNSGGVWLSITPWNNAGGEEIPIWTSRYGCRDDLKGRTLSEFINDYNLSAIEDRNGICERLGEIAVCTNGSYYGYPTFNTLLKKTHLGNGGEEFSKEIVFECKYRGANIKIYFRGFFIDEDDNYQHAIITWISVKDENGVSAKEMEFSKNRLGVLERVGFNNKEELFIETPYKGYDIPPCVSIRIPKRLYVEAEMRGDDSIDITKKYLDSKKTTEETIDFVNNTTTVGGETQNGVSEENKNITKWTLKFLNNKVTLDEIIKMKSLSQIV